jgi:glycosyltransferase involved in cell wall biosynthesis
MVRVILISSVRPEPTRAGEIILYRHLMNQPGLTLEVYGSEPQRPNLSRLIRRVAGRLGNSRLCRCIEDFWVLWDGRWIDPELPVGIESHDQTVVLTVAHGDGFMAARRFARRHKLPLVSIFHDWWPDMVKAHPPAQRLLERKFRELARESAVALCVCEGMEEALGSVPNAVVLPPIPAEQPTVGTPPRDPAQPFKIVCSGNLTEYGPMLGDALEESLKYPEILLQVRGSKPAWSEERKARMRANGRWLDFAPRAELDAWLASADAFLVPMVFDSAMCRRMETSFPSKLVEFAQFAKPVVIWGPESCSAIRWARDGAKALCVTDPAPIRVIGALRLLSGSLSQTTRYTAAMARSAAGEFNPRVIQQAFETLLSTCTKPKATLGQTE